MLGHSDGMVRWIDENSVIVNDFSNESKSFNDRLIRSLKKCGLNIKFMKYGEGFFSKIRDWGAYLNFIKINGLLIVPVYGTDDDYVAIEQIKKIYGGCKVETINFKRNHRAWRSATLHNGREIWAVELPPFLKLFLFLLQYSKSSGNSTFLFK